MYAFEAAKAVTVLTHRNSHVLDIGAGAGQASNFFREKGLATTAIDIGDFGAPNLIKEDFNTYPFEDVYFDVVWASHVLEHQLNVNAFLKKCRSLQLIGDIIAITVPPYKPNVVGGHLTWWNAGQVMYNLILAGYNCKNAHILKYDYNISVIAYAEDFDPLEIDLKYDNGDIETLKEYFPEGYNFQGFNGDINVLNWPT